MARPEVVFLDVGGVLYDDGVYARALRTALRELGASMTDAEFDAEYAACRADQRGPFRERLASRFLGGGADIRELQRRASRHWSYPPGSLHADVRPCLDSLAGRYRLGLIANQQSSVRAAMARDGIDGFFEIWGISEDLGLAKPDVRLYEHALRTAGVPGERAAMAGDRLDYDVRPARRVGMRAIWVLRGEAPDEPTAEQLAEADAAVRGLAELPGVLEAEGSCGS